MVMIKMNNRRVKKILRCKDISLFFFIYLPLEQRPLRIKHFIDYAKSYQSQHGYKKEFN